jgi:hypothetical protein
MLSTKEKWQGILSDIEKPAMPMYVLDRIIIRLIDGTEINIDVLDLLASGDAEEIEAMVHDKLNSLEDVIDDVDFFVNIDSVAQTVQPATDLLLRKL